MPSVWNQVVRRGTRYPNAMVPTSNCCPSRASLLTGLYSHSTTVWSNTAGWPTFRDAGMEQRTIAVWLQRDGYRTGLVGKYLNEFRGSTRPPGWSIWHSFVGSNSSCSDYQLLNTHGSLTSYGSTPSDYSTTVLQSNALRFLRSTPVDRPPSSTSQHTHRTSPRSPLLAMCLSRHRSDPSPGPTSTRRTSATSHHGSVLSRSCLDQGSTPVGGTRIDRCKLSTGWSTRSSRSRRHVHDSATPSSW